MNCDQCEFLSINGVGCHESGCPNGKKIWNGEGWVKAYYCRCCGEQAEEGEFCCTDEFPEPGEIRETGR